MKTYTLHDTLSEQVVVTVMDTLREVTTITVRENEAGDTIRITTVTDRSSSRDRLQLRVESEKLIVVTDTVYVEKQAESSAVAVVGTSTEVLPDGTIRPKGVILKWIFFILLALTALIVALRIFVFKR